MLQGKRAQPPPTVAAPSSPVAPPSPATFEERIRAELPQMRKIFIEVDSRGDGRGLEPLRAITAGAPDAAPREAP